MRTKEYQLELKVIWRKEESFYEELGAEELMDEIVREDWENFIEENAWDIAATVIDKNRLENVNDYMVDSEGTEIMIEKK